MARIDRSIGILIAAGIAASLIIYALTSNIVAMLITIIVTLFGVALLFDSVERRVAAQTRHRARTKAARPDRDRIEALLQALPHPSLIVHLGRIESCNEATLALLGRHIIGQDVRLALRHPAAIDRLVGPKANSAPSRVEIIGLGSASQSWELDVQPIGEGRILALLFDQSGKQAAERMRVDFVANASHELRTPLAGILGFVETLRDPAAGGDDATRERFLGIIDGEARRMHRLVDDLMSLSRIEADKYRQPDQSVGIVQLIEEVAQVFRQSQNKRAQDLVLKLDAEVPPVRGDRAQLSQLLHNLISNGLKYGAADTPVTVVAQAGGNNMVTITVTDHGEGIAQEHLPRLTERFYRIDSGRSRALGGTGLGLAIVKHIVERHRGILRFESEQGEGTTVRVEIPIFQALKGHETSSLTDIQSQPPLIESQK